MASLDCIFQMMCSVYTLYTVQYTYTYIVYIFQMMCTLYSTVYIHMYSLQYKKLTYDII